MLKLLYNQSHYSNVKLFSIFTKVPGFTHFFVFKMSVENLSIFFEVSQNFSRKREWSFAVAETTAVCSYNRVNRCNFVFTGFKAILMSISFTLTLFLKDTTSTNPFFLSFLVNSQLETEVRCIFVTKNKFI